MFFAVLKAPSRVQLALIAFNFCGLLTLLTQGWIATGLDHLQGVSPWSSLPALYALGTVFRLPYLLLMALLYKFKNAINLRTLISIALLFSAADNIFLAINPDIFGYGLIIYPYLVQIADIGSGGLLSLVLTAINLFLLYSLLRRNLKGVSIALLILLGCFSYSTIRLEELKNGSQNEKTIKAVIIQGATKRGQKLKDLAQLKRYMSLTRKAIKIHPSAELIVWPESSYPGFFPLQMNGHQKDLSQLPLEMKQFMAELKVPLIFGSNRNASAHKGQTRFNTAFISYRSEHNGLARGHLDFYDKKKLIPVGELKVPFIPSTQYDYSIGEQVESLTLPGEKGNIKFRPLICFESVFPGMAFESAKQTSFLVTLNNDSWFKGSDEPRIHLLASQLRSIETRKPQIFASETGPSTFFGPTGDMFNVSQYGKSAIIFGEVPLRSPTATLAARFYRWVPLIFVFFALMGLFGPRKKNQTSS